MISSKSNSLVRQVVLTSLLVFFVLFSYHPVAAFADPSADIIIKKNGRFFCPNEGKIIVYDVNDSPEVVCVYNGKKYNALTGKIIPSPGFRSANVSPAPAIAPSVPSVASNTRNGNKVVSRKKSSLVVNNYYDDSDDSNVKTRQNQDSRPSKPRIKGERKFPFTGIHAGFGYGLGFFQLSTDYSNLPNNTSFTNLVSTINQNANSSGFINIGADYQVSSRFVVGLEVLIPLIHSSIDITPPVFNTSAGKLPPTFVSSVNSLINITVRAGIPFSRFGMVYFGAGVDVSRFSQSNTTKSANLLPVTWSPLQIVTVSPKISAGVELLILEHLVIRLEYTLIYYVPQNFDAIDTTSPASFENPSTWHFGYSGFNNIFRIIIAGKFF